MTLAPLPTSIIGEPEVVEDGVPFTARTAEKSGAWLDLRAAATELQGLQAQDGSIAKAADHVAAVALVARIVRGVATLAPAFPHDAAYLQAVRADLDRWVADGLGVPDFLDSLVAFAPAEHRVDRLRHLVVFPMYTQNGSTDRHVEALLVEVIWPEMIAELEQTYTNRLFLPLRLVDFTPGFDTDSAVLFPETVAVRAVPEFTWGAIFQDREAARFRVVVREAAAITKLELLPSQLELLDDQRLAEETFVMWDLIHDRSHMRGDLPFDPFMIKQRMPYFLYSLEELRCDLTAFRECIALERADDTEERTRAHARHVQHAIIYDRIFRFALTGSRVRNYDGLGGQLLFAWLHQHGVLHWTDSRLTIDWSDVPEVVVQLAEAINELYWKSIDRPKVAHWLAAHELVSRTLEPHPASVWAKGLPREILTGPPKGYTDAVLDDEFPLSMFYEALGKKLRDVIDSTKGIVGTGPVDRGL